MTRPTEAPTISAIVPARNSEQTIGECLQALLESGTPVHEIIVVNDASTDTTLAIARRYGVNTIDLSTKHDANHCRNLGASKASGDVLLFVDSDVVLQPGAVHNILESLRDKTIDAVVGLYSAKHRHANIASQYKNLWIRYSYLRSHRSVDWIFGAIAAIRKEAFGEAGGFDRTLFMHKGGEDLELGKRMARKRPSIILNPAVEVEHLKRHSLCSLLKNDFVRSQGFVKLATNLGQFARSFFKGFVNIYPGFAYSAVLSWAIVLCHLLGTWSHPLFWTGLVCTAVYLILNYPFLRYFTHHRGLAETPGVVGVMFLDHLACGLGSLKGIIRWLLFRDE
ncbi:glycosyltransferase family 2 protein [bacterium]|nr:MAG: glycosyltransferase family 2 protein [bacterium]